IAKIAIGKSNIVERGRIDAEAVITNVNHGADILGKVDSTARRNVPSGIQVPARIADALSKASAHVERESRNFLGHHHATEKHDRTCSKCQADQILPANAFLNFSIHCESPLLVCCEVLDTS